MYSKSKKGQVIFYGLMLGITIMVLTLALAGPVKERIEEARGDMDCSNSTISNFDKGACLVSDLNIFYFIGSLILIGGAVITARIIFT